MVHLPSIPLLHNFTLDHGDAEPRASNSGKQYPKARPSASSLASLVRLARNPIENIGEAVENWYDGTTKEERARRQSLADRKQLLYLKMRMVSLSIVSKWTVAAHAD